MFRLIKLAMLGLFGYAIYEFFRGMMHDTRLGDTARNAYEQARQGQLGGGQRDERGRFLPRGAQTGDVNMSGPGRGTEEATLERNGGSVRHKVGRGVVS